MCKEGSKVRNAMDPVVLAATPEETIGDQDMGETVWGRRTGMLVRSNSMDFKNSGFISYEKHISVNSLGSPRYLCELSLHA